MEFLEEGSPIDEYHISKLLGKGAMGQVYLAVDGKDNFYVIKESGLCDSSDEQQLAFSRFTREAELLKSVTHPGLPAYYKTFQYRDRAYIVMEYIKGETLEGIISKASKPLEEKKVLYWGLQLCEILFYLHTLTPEPIIYRDLKPSNVIITSNDTLRLVDFGVARRYDPSKNSDTMRFGTPGYAAPEQYRKDGQSTPRSDIYALGALLHQLLTLRDPAAELFKFPSIKSLNPSVSEQLEWIINKAINYNAGDRYVDAGLFRDELLHYYNETPGLYISPYKKCMPFMNDGVARLKTKKTITKFLFPFVVVFEIFLLIALITYPQFHTCFLPLMIGIIFLFLFQREYED